MQCFQNSLRQSCSALLQLHAPLRRYRSGGWGKRDAGSPVRGFEGVLVDLDRQIETSRSLVRYWFVH